MTARLLAVGDNVVDCYPDLGVMFPGGNAVNVAVHARRVGAHARYLGVLGTDEAGDLLHRSLREERVDTGLTRVEPGPNAYAVVQVVDGNRVFSSSDVGVSRFRLTDDDFEAARRADLVHTGECSMVEDDLARLAAAAPRLSFDFSERPWDYIEQHARHADIAVLSLAGTADEPARVAERVARLGPAIVVVTQGPAGATLHADGRTLHAPAGPGEIVDTLGAGDAFIARLLVGLLRGEPLDDLLPAATSYATQTCREYGAFGHSARLPTGFTTPTASALSSSPSARGVS